MGNLIMVLGKSGSGKSTSLRNFSADEVGVFSVAGKRLPFRSRLPVVNHAGYQLITKVLKANKRRCYVIDDAGYLMQFDNFARVKEKGYEKFTDMALAFEQLLMLATATNDDTNVYFLMHPEESYDGGTERIKTIGKMLSEKLCIEGLFPIVLDCETRMDENGKATHVFVTENDGTNLAKAPMGMFEPVIDNDLKMVDQTIRDYWEMGPIVDTPPAGGESEA
jgi:hypothetical protein